MKKFAELSDLEIYNLSPEQIKTYKKIELAENGIVFPVEPTKPQLTEELKPDLVVYAIPLIGRRIAFTNKEDADKVLAIMQQTTTSGLLDEYGIPRFVPGFGKDYNGRTNMLAVEPQAVYSSDVYEQNKLIKEQNAKLETAYKKARAEYDELIERVSEALEEMNSRINEAREVINKRISLTFRLKTDYLPIADDNIETAMRFLKLAYTVTDEDEAYIRSHYNESQDE
ncbi:MAG: hypothetical protein IJS13_07175 [Paludibacteraceae bacterium]|nr:hypothetical protein [Paludibacteraceae bacterium]